MGIKFLILLLFFSTAEASELDSAAKFLGWLESHSQDFAACEPASRGDDYVLCDQTHVPKADLKKMFAMKPAELIEHLHNKGIKVELVCAKDEGAPNLGKNCVQESSNKMFTEITALHGKYVAGERTIYIRNSASLGSLVHEYVHYLQSENTNVVYGRVYKSERNKIQQDLTAIMDKDIAAVQALEKAHRESEIKPRVEEFQRALETLRSFAPWQDLIDERGIFQLYLKFGKEFGASGADFALARKNMGFFCKNPKLNLPKNQCGG